MPPDWADIAELIDDIDHRSEEMCYTDTGEMWDILRIVRSKISDMGYADEEAA